MSFSLSWRISSFNCAFSVHRRSIEALSSSFSFRTFTISLFTDVRSARSFLFSADRRLMEDWRSWRKLLFRFLEPAIHPARAVMSGMR